MQRVYWPNREDHRAWNEGDEVGGCAGIGFGKIEIEGVGVKVVNEGVEWILGMVMAMKKISGLSL
jgi:hypothetical protein